MEISPEREVKVVGTYEKISSGFVNIAYIFPQKKVEHKLLEEISIKVGAKLASRNHLGTAELTFVVSNYQGLFLEKVQCYSTHLTSALNYYRFLSDGRLESNGDYMAKIIDTFDNDGKEEEVVTYEPRSFCYVPFLLHFGLSERQANSFFQLCRMGGVSFDL